MAPPARRHEQQQQSWHRPQDGMKSTNNRDNSDTNSNSATGISAPAPNVPEINGLI
jgi:hypothetical protein